MGDPGGRVRQVYRLLRKPDISPALAGRTVHIFWPDNGLWYQATVRRLLVRSRRARLFYPETEEIEDIDLKQLICENSIAVGAPSPVSRRRRRTPSAWLLRRCAGRSSPRRDEEGCRFALVPTGWRP